MDWSGLNANALKSFPGYENNHDVTISENDTEMTFNSGSSEYLF